MKHVGRLPAPTGFKKNRTLSRTDDVVEAIRGAIQSIPRGRVASYGQVAAAAGYPRHVRMVPRVLNLHGDGLPWHRVTGAGGAIKLAADDAREQRLRLQAEGIRFRGAKVDLAAHEHTFLT